MDVSTISTIRPLETKACFLSFPSLLSTPGDYSGLLSVTSKMVGTILTYIVYDKAEEDILSTNPHSRGHPLSGI
jgi:hypothetical protein